MKIRLSTPTKIMASILSLFLVISTAHAFGGHGGKGNHKDKMEKLIKKLDLTEEQQTQLNIFKEEHNFEPLNHRATRKEVMKKVLALDTSDPNFESDIEDIADEASVKAAVSIKNAILFKGKLLSILNPEQKEKMAKMRKRMMARWEDKHH